MGFTHIHTCNCGHDLRDHDDYFDAEAKDGKFQCNAEGCTCGDFTQTIEVRNTGVDAGYAMDPSIKDSVFNRMYARSEEIVLSPDEIERLKELYPDEL